MGNVQDVLRKQWKDGMKEALHHAVVKVLSEDGLDGLTLDRITHVAGIAKGTVYNYFKDKRDLLQYVVRSSMEPLEHEQQELFASDMTPPQKIRALALTNLSYFDKNRDFYRILLDPEFSGPRLDSEAIKRHQRLISNVSMVFEEGIKSGYFRSAPSTKLAAMLIMACISITRGRLWNEDFGPIEDDANLVVDIFFKGIAKGGCKK